MLGMSLKNSLLCGKQKPFMVSSIQTEPFSLHELMRYGPLEIKAKRMTEEQFLRFVMRHEDLRIEQDKNGLIYIMPPVGYDSGINEGHPYGALYAWWLTFQKGRVCSPSTMFRLPDGSKKMADGAWISEEKHKALRPQERKRIASVVPDFIIEVRSETDDVEVLFKKMTDTWIANGVRLAWLIDPVERKAWVFKSNGVKEEVPDFKRQLSGEEICPGLKFNLSIMNL